MYVDIFFVSLYVLHVSDSLTGAATRFKLLILLEPIITKVLCFYSEYALVRHRHHQVTCSFGDIWQQLKAVHS